MDGSGEEEYWVNIEEASVPTYIPEELFKCVLGKDSWTRVPGEQGKSKSTGHPLEQEIPAKGSILKQASSPPLPPPPPAQTPAPKQKRHWRQQLQCQLEPL